MKLQIVPASTGLSWVKLGVKTFFRQPLAMSGLFFMFMATVSLLSVVPVIGSAISLALVPAATVGLMAASREAAAGRFPMPVMLLTAFRSGAERARPMLVLGGMYAGALLLVLGLAALMGSAGGTPMELPGGEVTPEAMRTAFLSQGMWVAMLAYVPVLMAFWHAPALVHWHGVSPGKSLFFSIMACWRNKGAMLVYSLGWLGVFLLMGLMMSLLGAMLGGASALGLIMYPMVLFMASMFHTSIYFTFRDSFDTGEPPELAEPTA
ncbi:MAG: BPSS1780 family membrane protein [Hydrogenophaga sp.]|uniref:BPSS1780 family membrane protein n=1 Tax=Hydrogenophaga sp. TaxID=1904254 RepID=UPI002ABC6C03|nr:BPSS1780 family membrane protein [Hydrogenophaga sp.]MDZ4186520.1 BPSS1780 family membrane protein [Hydrogenophaga sp.]